MNTDTFPWDIATNPLLLSCLAITGLVISDFCDWRRGRYLCKPLAAIAFIWLALVLGAGNSSYSSWLLAGLFACLLGDLLLMGESDRFFLGGLFAFLLGHLLYAVAFFQLPVNPAGLGLSVLPVAVLITGTIRWLHPHLDSGMRGPVIAYILVISAMLLCAGMTLGSAGASVILLGAWGFACSDLSVARRQFVKVSRWNGVWGSPLYFGSQMLLASSVALT